MSFLGQPRRKPINLGNKQQKTRKDILFQAEQNRAARQVSREQTNAAIILQRAARSRRALRADRIRALRKLESKQYPENDALVADFIYVCPVYYEARNPAALIKRIATAVSSPFLHSQLLTALNSLWDSNSPHIEPIHCLYTPEYPHGIIAPLHAYAARNPGHRNFLRNIFDRLTLAYPEDILALAINHNVLLDLGVDLSKLSVSATQIQAENIPKSRLLKLLSSFLTDPLRSVPIIAQLVILLPPKLPKAITEPIGALFTHSFVKKLIQLDIGARNLAAFILPLLSSPEKLRLLMQFSILDPDLTHKFWAEFVCSPTYKELLQSLDSGLAFIGRPQDWTLLVSMLELYSYRLIVSGDAQMFEILGHSEVLNLSRCLKAICSQICDGKNPPLDGRFNNSFFSVTKQIFIRSERREFLPQGFWLVPHLLQNYSPSDLQKLLAFMDDGEEDSDDEEEPEIRIRLPQFIETLKRAPFFVDFFTRADIFSQFIAHDKMILPPVYNTIFSDGVATYRINRENMAVDTAAAFKKLMPNNGIKTMLRFTVYSNGQPEPGIDGGGLAKEVLTSSCADVFVSKKSPLYSDLFIEAPDHTVYPNPKYRAKALTPAQAEAVHERYLFLGLIIGKCLYESIMVDVHFSPFFLQKWAGVSSAKSSFDDFYLLDPEMYAGLQKLAQYEGNVEDLALDFTIDDGTGNTVELKCNGASLSVTNENKLEYIHLVSSFRLNESIRSQTTAFLRGVTYFISPNWLKTFSTREIQTLISGENDDFDPEDLRRHSVSHGFAMDHYIDYFWDVVREMTAEERQALLRFVTSVPRGPLLGFAKLNPMFALRSAGRTDERLPTASTCVNLLKLPEYSSKEVLREKLLYAINSNSGFDLS